MEVVYRRSYQEGIKTKVPSQRRKERYSLRTDQSFDASLLEHVQVQFIKAYIPTNKLSRPRYVMKVSNAALQYSWEMVRPFRDFCDLKEKALKVLADGHLCSSNCPWLYMYISHRFPRHHLFRSRRPRVVSERLGELETFINMLLRQLQENSSFSCRIYSQSIPKLLSDFLYEGMTFNSSVIQKDGEPVSGVSQESGGNEEMCMVCLQSLKYKNVISIPFDDNVTRCSSGDFGSTIDKDVSLTTLFCGHRFHDECILAKLNENPSCPSCVQARSC